MSDIKREIRELPAQEVIYEDDLFALDSDESNQTGKITYKQLIDKIREDIFAEIQDIIDGDDEPEPEPEPSPEPDPGPDHDQEQDQQIAEINKTLLAIFDKVYPVGSIFMSLESNDPATIFGGEWERIQDRFLFGLGNTNKYGALGDLDGYSEIKLSAKESGVPGHNHPFTRPNVDNSGGGGATTASGAHSHQLGWHKDNIAKGGTWNRPDNSTATTARGYLSTTAPNHTHNIPNHSHTLSGGSVGYSTAKDAESAHNNMPPYIVVNMWKRTKLASEVTDGGA